MKYNRSKQMNRKFLIKLQSQLSLAASSLPFFSADGRKNIIENARGEITGTFFVPGTRHGTGREICIKAIGFSGFLSDLTV